jgi:hypothetical protein
MNEVLRQRYLRIERTQRVFDQRQLPQAKRMATRGTPLT